MITLFHVSKTPNLTTLTPRIPSHFLTAHYLEEYKTPRVSFAPTIEKCLRAVQSRSGDKFYVYTPVSIDRKYLRRVSINEVPDAALTGEYWYLKPVNVRLYGVVKAGKLYDPKVIQVGVLEAKRPADKPLFAISRNREYELLERYNKNGRAMTRGLGMKNVDPSTLRKSWKERIFGKKDSLDLLDNHDFFDDDFSWE